MSDRELSLSSLDPSQASPVMAHSGYAVSRALARTDLLLAGGAGLLAGLIYWLGAAPGVLFGDGGELQFAAWTAGLPHPTGYPLYMILGWAWTHLLAMLQLATPARAMNLLSVIFAAWAVALTYLLAHGLVELSVPEVPRVVQRLAGLVAALVFGLTPTFWSQALVTEVYTLHAALVALSLGLATRWYKQLRLERTGGDLSVSLAAEQRPPVTARDRPAPALIVLALVLGLGLAHHRTTLLLVPVLVLFVWRQDGYRLRRPRWLIILSLLALLPVLLYLYVPLRAPETTYLSMELTPGRAVDLINRSPRGLVGYMLGRSFAGELQGPREALAALPGLLQRFSDEMGFVGLGLALLGVLNLVIAKRRRLLWLTGSSFLLLTGFNLFYTIEDIAVFYIPSYLIVACWIAVAVAFVAQELARLPAWRGPGRPLAAGLSVVMVLVPLVVLPAWLFLNHGARLDRSGHTRPQRWWEGLLASPPARDAILVSNDRDEMMPLWYAQQVEGIRPDVAGIFPGLLPGDHWDTVGQVVENALASGRPVSLVKPMPGLDVKVKLGTNNRVGLTPVEGLAVTHAPQRPQDVVMGEVVRLAGYEVSPLHPRPGDTVQVDLYWQPVQRMVANYTSFVHLRQDSGRVIAQSDRLLGGVFYPTSQWKPGEMLLDRHRIEIPAGEVAGPYQLFAGLYQLVGQEARTLGSVVLTGQVGGQPPEGARGGTVENAFYANLNDEILLVGFDLAGERLAAIAGSRPSARAQTVPVDDLLVRLLWQAARPMAVDYTLFIHLLAADGTIVVQRDTQPFNGRYPTSVWEQGELLAGTYRLPLPAGLAGGDYSVVVGMVQSQLSGGKRLPAYDDRGQRFANDRIELARVILN